MHALPDLNQGAANRIGYAEAKQLLKKEPTILRGKREVSVSSLDARRDCFHAAGADVDRAFSFYRVRLTGGVHPELLVVGPNGCDEGPPFRSTLHQNRGGGYRVSEALRSPCDYHGLIDVRDLNGDGLEDLVLSESNASSYSYYPTIVWWDGRRLRSQHFDGLLGFSEGRHVPSIVVEKKLDLDDWAWWSRRAVYRFSSRGAGFVAVELRCRRHGSDSDEACPRRFW